MRGDELLKAAPPALPEPLDALLEATLFSPKAKSRVSGPTAMELLVIIRHHKTTIFGDARSRALCRSQHLVEGIGPRSPAQQPPYKDDQLPDDSMTPAECGSLAAGPRLRALRPGTRPSCR